jgi:hypothetical protein
MFVAACDHGSPKACEVLSDDYRFGASVVPDASLAQVFATRAVDMYEHECARGVAGSCLSFASLTGSDKNRDRNQLDAVYHRGSKLQQEDCENGDRLACISSATKSTKEESAGGGMVAWLRKACDLGDGTSCYLLAQRHIVGAQWTDDEAGFALERGCVLGVTPACEDAGDRFMDGSNIRGSVAIAAERFRRANEIASKQCAEGDARACVRVSEQFRRGRGVAQDAMVAKRFSGRAVAIYREDCDTGDAMACDTLGDALNLGYWGVLVDLGQAMVLYEKACRRDAALGCDKLAKIHQFELGEAQDGEKVGELYRKACDAGDAKSCFAIGDSVQGIAVGDKMCSQGNRFACEDLSSRFENGEGVSVDRRRADVLNSSACALGGGHDCQKYEK